MFIMLLKWRIHMKILVLTGSPHKNGTSFYLANQFIKCAEESDHKITRYDAAFLKLEGCLGCKYCRTHDNMCIRHDIIDEINKEVLAADVLVFATPLFFFGISAQLKTLIDRFYAILKDLQKQKENNVQKKYMILTTCNDKEETTLSALLQSFKTLGNNFGWTEGTHVLAEGYNKEHEIIDRIYAKQAYKISKNL